MKHLFFAIVLIIASGCGSVVDNTISNSLEGSWEAFEIIDVPTNDTLRASSFTYTLGGKACDAFRLFDDKSFNVYYQNGNSIFGTSTGTWRNDLNELTLDFDFSSSIVIRTVSIDNDTLDMSDIIFGREKIVRFEKVQ